MKLGMQVGLGHGHIVLDAEPAPLPQRGTAPNYQPISDNMAAWIKMSLGMELGLGPGDFVLDGDPAPPPQKGEEPPPPNFRPMFIMAKRLDGLSWYLARR